MNTFLWWCQSKGITDAVDPNLKEKETVKETYIDAEISNLVDRPGKTVISVSILFENALTKGGTSNG